MAREPEYDGLLDDVLAEAVPAEFQAQLLDRTVSLARIRRRRRRTRRVAGAALSVIVPFVAVVWAAVLRDPVPDPGQGCPILATQPLPSEAVIRSRAFASTTQTTRTPEIQWVRTDPANDLYRIIGDEALLALAEPRSAVLVRVGPHAQELIFVNESVQ